MTFRWSDNYVLLKSQKKKKNICLKSHSTQTEFGVGSLTSITIEPSDEK